MNDAGSTCSRTGIGSVIQAWRKVVQKVESKSQSKAAAAMWQKPAADSSRLWHPKAWRPVESLHHHL